MNFRYIFILLLVSASFIATAQVKIDSFSSIKIDTIFIQNTSTKAQNNQFRLTERLPITNTFNLLDYKTLENLDRSIIYDTIANIIAIPTITSSDTFLLQYRYFKDVLPDSISRSYKTGLENKVSYIALDIPKNTQDRSLIPKGLNYSGSFGRGLTAGNSQSLVLNSTFNMQLGGKIGADIDLRAVISDANIPIQAEGTTQQLQEFDQVFIELTKDQQQLIAGDYRLNRPTGHFINYSKKLKGIKYSNQSIYDTKGKLSVSGSYAISGGKFARNILATQEGNQGPYKLQGSDNEQFIIVQSGSEKVYVDGEIITRGENNDYIIFYDRAEITFMEKMPITKDRRVIVEFEYLVQNFARSISTANAEYVTKKHQVQLRMYNESDNKNSSGVFELSEEDKIFLAQAGDNPTNTLKSGIFINDNFTINDVFYSISFSSEGDTVLQYSTDPTLTKYQAIFTDLGESQGSYSIDNEVNTNGRVYKYVGEGNGRYDPVRKLIPPETKQMYSLSDRFQYSKNGALFTEFSLSNFDENLFSEMDDNDDVSYAFRLDWGQKLNWGKRNGQELQISMLGEFLHEDFSILNPYRNAEFQRDWNLPITNESEQEILGGTSLQWSAKLDSLGKNTNDIQYDFKTYRRGNAYVGNKHFLQDISRIGNTTVNLQSSFLTTESDEFTSVFIRPRGNIDQKWKKLGNFHTGISYDGEYNNRKDAQTDTLLSNSNEYDELKVYAASDTTKIYRMGISYTKRIDRNAYEAEQKTFAIADNYGTNFSLNGKTQRLNLTLNYRVLETNESIGQSVEDATNMLGGIDYQYSFWDGLIKGVSNVNFNSGQEPKLEFDYREVAVGEGNYVWIDDGDGLQDKNEFQIAPFADQGNFIRVSLFNNEFIQVYKQDYSQTLRINPVKWKISKKKWKKALSRISSQTSMRVSRKDMQDDGLPDFQLVNIDPLSATLVSYLSSINQSIFWNRGNPSYDIHFNYLTNNSSLLLTTGNEARNNEQYTLNFRKNILKKGDIIVKGIRSTTQLQNLNFSTNNYNIGNYTGELSFTYRVRQNLELRTACNYTQKKNNSSIEESTSTNFNAGITYANSKRTRVDFSTSYNRINYMEGENPTIELVMLEGLKNGNNFLWEIRFTKRLINNFDLTLNYNGRKTADSPTIHVANAQIKATF